MAEKPKRFHTIKRKPSTPGISMKWGKGTPDGAWIMDSRDDPHPATTAFNGAFDAFKEPIVKYLGLTKAQAQKVIATGVHLKFNTEGEVKVQLLGSWGLDGFAGPMNIQIPAQVPDADLENLISFLEVKAVDYLNGEKGQLELPVKEEDGEE